MSDDVFTWLLVISGWVVVHRMTLNRERRKEKRDIAETAIKNLIELEAEAVKFHCDDHFDAQAMNSILWKTNRLISSFNRAPMCELLLTSVSLKELRQSITLKNFDCTGFIPQSVHSRIVTDICLAVDKLIVYIEEKKMKVWP
jgi:hypothetical protein